MHTEGTYTISLQQKVGSLVAIVCEKKDAAAVNVVTIMENTF